MKTYILRNIKTGWEGGVTEKMYQDRLKRKNGDYIDPRNTESTDKDEVPAESAESNEGTAQVTSLVINGEAQWVVTSRSPGWFDVVRGDEVANEKGLREAAAEELASQLNAS